jgi:DnaJ-domain-containing protein 1
MENKIDLLQLEIDITERIRKEYDEAYRKLEKRPREEYEYLAKQIRQELKAQHWDILKKAIDENPNIKFAWDNFLMVLRLAQPDIHIGVE